MKRVLITICGRAGSKGFKNKNLKSFLGHPLVYYSLAAAFDFKERNVCETDICLNTDSKELGDIVKAKYPEVEYIRRSEELGGDRVPKAAVWHNCLDYMEDKYKTKYDYILDLDITSPLRQKDDVFNAFKLKLEREDADLVESGCPSRRNPYFNMVKEDGDYVSTVIHSEFTTRQEAPNIYDENASIYVLDAAFIRESKDNMLNKAKTCIYIMKDTAVLDIDGEEDFELMQLIAEYLYNNNEEYRAIKNRIRQ